MTLVITYRKNTVNHETGVHTVSGVNDAMQAVQEYQASHPDRKVMHVFDVDDDILVSEKTASQKFTSQCAEYGFDPSDYNKSYHAPGNSNDIYRLVGFLPHNRKYKCRVEQVLSGHTMKATPAYVRRMLDEYPA